MAEIEQGKNGDTAKTNIIAEISRPSRAESIPELVEFVAGVERQRGFPEKRIGEIGLALQEALKNILEHSHRNKGADIAITCKLDPWGKFMIVIVDSGDPSNILLADVIFAEEEGPVDREKRASAKLIKKMVDNVEYKRVDQTNVLTFTVVLPFVFRNDRSDEGLLAGGASAPGEDGNVEGLSFSEDLPFEWRRR
jgi:anti-sigma regulatory factor (Ser/Thr protein kinase)